MSNPPVGTILQMSFIFAQKRFVVRQKIQIREEKQMSSSQNVTKCINYFHESSKERVPSMTQFNPRERTNMTQWGATSRQDFLGTRDIIPRIW
jgi:hypothetical protein